MKNRCCPIGRSPIFTLAFLLVVGGMADLAASPPREVRVNDPTKLINRLLADSWKANGLKPSARTSDAEFIRRVSVDIIGRTPTQKEVHDFEKNAKPDKRAALVQRLLADPGYAVKWADTWTNWLLPKSYNRLYRGQTRKWLEAQFARKVSHKELVRKLLTATGKSSDNGAVHFILAHLGESIPKDNWAEDGQFDMVPITAATTRLFLGYRFECIQCHDHAYSAEWKQKHFWGLNAFFRQVERKGLYCASPQVALPVELLDNPAFNKTGSIQYEGRNKVVRKTKPTFPNGKQLGTEEKRTRREVLAAYIVGHDNFSPAFVNRMWGHFFGRGLLEIPDVDDFGEHHPPVHPKMLEELAKAFAASGHDPKQLISWICNSDAYQLQTAANTTNKNPKAAPYFSRMVKKTR